MDKIEGEINTDLMYNIIKTLPKLTAIHSTDHAILIHVMGGQTRAFFRELNENKKVQVLWTDWIGKSWWSYIFSFIPGQAGLVKILDRNHLDTLYEEIGDTAYCGLYFIPDNKVENILEEIKLKKDNENIEEILKNEANYFLLEVDFDYPQGDKNAVFYRRLAMGDNLDVEIRRTLKQTE